jgi:hypothetical protein
MGLSSEDAGGPARVCDETLKPEQLSHEPMPLRRH